MFHRDGVQKLSTSNTFSAPNTTGNSLFFASANYAIAEAIIYDSALGTTDRQAVEDYLGQKFGITITH